MSEKKICKMNDEEMKNVVGGKDEHSASDNYTLPNIDIQDYGDANITRVVCPECGKDQDIYGAKGTTIGGVCPHCNKPFTVTL